MTTMIFFITLVLISPSGEAYIETKFPNDAKYNTQESCNLAGQMWADNYQKKANELGGGKVFWSCNSVDYNSFTPLVKPGNNL